MAVYSKETVYNNAFGVWMYTETLSVETAASSKTITATESTVTLSYPGYRLKWYRNVNPNYSWDVQIAWPAQLYLSRYSSYKSNSVGNNTWTNWIYLANTTVDTSSLFSSSNKTTRTVTASTKSGGTTLGNTKGSIPGPYTTSSPTLFTIYVTLDAPPLVDATEVTFDTSAPYAGKTTATVTLSNLEAQYGGDITSATLTIGDQVSDPRTTDGDLTIDLNAVGSFDPVVTVTDSRGQVRTIQLSTIYVYAYICNVSMATVERIDASTNKLKDEGTNALLKANFNYSAYTGSSLIAPVVKINDTVTNNVTWYTSWNNTSGFSGQVSDWSAILSGQTLYAKISDNFGINTSYTIDLYPQTTVQAASSESFVSLTLSQAFYLIAGKAGGHGLGIGKKPSENDFEVAMVSTFEDKVYVLDELKVYDDATFREDIILDLVDYDLSGTTDYNIYEAICDLGWDSDVLIDDTIISI